MKRALLGSVLALAVAGCGGGGSRATEAPPETTAAPATPVAPAPPPAPGPVFTRFVEAAGAGRADAMWALLSRPSRNRLGPTKASFRRGAALGLERRVGSLARGGYRLIVAEQVTDMFAAAAIEGTKGRGAYAAALRLEGGAWKLELSGPVRLRALIPFSDRAATAQPQVAVGIVADADITGALLWVDGKSFAGGGGGTDPRHATAYGRPAERLARGRHLAVAFANTGISASATAWTFSVG